MTDRATPSDTYYSYLGPAGTFTEAALKLVEGPPPASPGAA